MLTLAHSFADTHVHALFARHAGLRAGVVTQCATNHAAVLHEAWRADEARPRVARLQALFEWCDDYVYELLHTATTVGRVRDGWQAHHVWPHFQMSGPRVLDFGGGLGLASALLADAGKLVTYMDVAGAPARFAAWLFAEAALPVEVVAVPVAGAALPLGCRWDLVLAEHVLDHVVDPFATARALAMATAPGGLLWLRPSEPGRPLPPWATPVETCALLEHVRAARSMDTVSRAEDGSLLLRAH